MRTPIFLALLALSAPATAQMGATSPAPASYRAVSFGDLNLESDQGRATLERRLNRAVEALCSTTPLAPSQAASAATAECVAASSQGLEGYIDSAVRANRAKAVRTAGL